MCVPPYGGLLISVAMEQEKVRQVLEQKVVEQENVQEVPEHNLEQNLKAYQVRGRAGEGVGRYLVAARNLKAGEEVMLEEPLIRVGWAPSINRYCNFGLLTDTSILFVFGILRFSSPNVCSGPYGIIYIIPLSVQCER